MANPYLMHALYEPEDDPGPQAPATSERQRQCQDDSAPPRNRNRNGREDQPRNKSLDLAIQSKKRPLADSMNVDPRPEKKRKEEANYVDAGLAWREPSYHRLPDDNNRVRRVIKKNNMPPTTEFGRPRSLSLGSDNRLPPHQLGPKVNFIPDRPSQNPIPTGPRNEGFKMDRDPRTAKPRSRSIEVNYPTDRAGRDAFEERYPSLNEPVQAYLPPPGAYYDQHSINEIFGFKFLSRTTLCMHCADKCNGGPAITCPLACAICDTKSHQGQVCPLLYCSSSYFACRRVPSEYLFPKAAEARLVQVRPALKDARVLADMGVIKRISQAADEIIPILTNPVVARFYEGKILPYRLRGRESKQTRDALARTENEKYPWPKYVLKNVNTEVRGTSNPKSPTDRPPPKIHQDKSQAVSRHQLEDDKRKTSSALQVKSMQQSKEGKQKASLQTQPTKHLQDDIRKTPGALQAKTAQHLKKEKHKTTNSLQIQSCKSLQDDNRKATASLHEPPKRDHQQKSQMQKDNQTTADLLQSSATIKSHEKTQMQYDTRKTENEMQFRPKQRLQEETKKNSNLLQDQSQRGQQGEKHGATNILQVQSKQPLQNDNQKITIALPDPSREYQQGENHKASNTLRTQSTQKLQDDSRRPEVPAQDRSTQNLPKQCQPEENPDTMEDIQETSPLMLQQYFPQRIPLFIPATNIVNRDLDPRRRRAPNPHPNPNLPSAESPPPVESPDNPLSPGQSSEVQAANNQSHPSTPATEGNTPSADASTLGMELQIKELERQIQILQQAVLTKDIEILTLRRQVEMLTGSSQ